MTAKFYRRLADFVMVVHWLTALFCLTGAFFAWRNHRVAFIHIPLVIWVATAAAMRWNCPLTPLENHLRKLAGEGGYEGGFIDHYLRFGPNKDRQDGASIALCVGGLNAALYAGMFLSQR